MVWMSSCGRAVEGERGEGRRVGREEKEGGVLKMGVGAGKVVAQVGGGVAEVSGRGKRRERMRGRRRGVVMGDMGEGWKLRGEVEGLGRRRGRKEGER